MSQTFFFFLIVGWFECFWGRPIRFREDFCFAFLRFCH